MDKWMTEEPKIKVTDLLGGFLASLGMILFMIVLHLITINESGNNGIVLNTTFKIFLGIMIFLLLMGVIYLLFQLLRWLAYMSNTPEWMKEEHKLERNK